jgi:hypothetical protein
MAIYYCNETLSKGKTCQTEEAIRSKLQTLKLEFLYLETNFEGKNIDTPLVSFPKKLLDNGLAF